MTKKERTSGVPFSGFFIPKFLPPQISTSRDSNFRLLLRALPLQTGASSQLNVSGDLQGAVQLCPPARNWQMSWQLPSQGRRAQAVSSEDFLFKRF
jgi:hypothetical protein